MQFALSSNINTAKLHSAKIQIENLAEALNNFKADVGNYPTTEEGLRLLCEAPVESTVWKGPYLQKMKVPLDPWGNAFIYYFPAEISSNQFDLYSLGINQKDDLGDKDDITNWREINFEYYGGLSQKTEVIIYVISALFFLMIFSVVLVLGKPTYRKVTSRFTKLSIIFIVLSISAFFTIPIFDKTIPSTIAFFLFISILLGCILLPVAGLASTFYEIRKDSFTFKKLYPLVLHILMLLFYGSIFIFVAFL